MDVQFGVKRRPEDCSLLMARKDSISACLIEGDLKLVTHILLYRRKCVGEILTPQACREEKDPLVLTVFFLRWSPVVSRVGLLLFRDILQTLHWFQDEYDF